MEHRKSRTRAFLCRFNGSIRLLMRIIGIERNENLSEWLNVRIFGKVVETEKSLALAMQKAKELQAREKENTRTPFIIIVKDNAK